MKDIRALWGFGWWAKLDSIGHALHFPKFIQRRLCDRWERSLDQSFWVEPHNHLTSSTSNVSVDWTWSRSGKN